MDYSFISQGNYNTLLGMNGGCPESPDGKRLIYARKNTLTAPETEVWICNTDLTNHRKIADVSSGNHNGPSATFIDNSTVVFRDGRDKHSFFRIMDVDTMVEKYSIFAKESHCAEGDLYPFSISENFLGWNPDYPEIDKCGIYVLNVKTSKIDFIVSEQELTALVEGHGMHTDEWTGQVSHVQLSPSGDAVMMRVSVQDCPVFGALACFDMKTRESHIIPDKPVHQLWFDNDTYMATRQFNQGRHIEMETSYIARFSKDGEELEVLGGIGNHIDGSPDRKFFAGDRCYPDFAPDVYLYKRGCKEPIATFEIPDVEDTIWKLKVHPNPSFSRDGKRLYYNRIREDGGSDAVFVDISKYVE